MPSLLNFIRHNGTLLTNEHGSDLAHCRRDSVVASRASIPDRHARQCRNSYGARPHGSVLVPSSFGYWRIPSSARAPRRCRHDHARRDNAPAPWCRSRARVATSVQSRREHRARERGYRPNWRHHESFTVTLRMSSPKPRLLTQHFWHRTKTASSADFVGIAIHCGVSWWHLAPVTARATDLLPDEPGGYEGFLGLFGAKYINPLLTNGNPVLNAWTTSRSRTHSASRMPRL